MPDITQATAGKSVTFSASTPRADEWMRQVYGNHTVTFRFPEEQPAALAFKEEAKAAGFRIATM